MRESGDNSRRNGMRRLGLAGMALATQLVDPAVTESKESDLAKPVVHTEQTARQQNEEAWFTRTLHAPQLLRQDQRKLEEAIERNAVPLPLQVEYFERALSAGGSLYRELNARNIEPERISDIFRAVDSVSAHMTTAYAMGEMTGMGKYFDIGNLKKASRMFTLQLKKSPEFPQGGTAFCNGFFTRSEHDAYFVTAKHCVSDTTASHEMFAPSGDVDIALLHEPEENLKQYGIQDPSILPVLENDASSESVAGQVVVSFSWGPDQKQRIDFSIATPFPKNIRQYYYGPTIDARDPSLASTMMFMKLPDEVMVTARDASGKAISNGTSGSSGSIVAAYGPHGYRVLGNFVSVNQIEDTCKHLCYPAAFATTPNAVNVAINEEREHRAKVRTVTESAAVGKEVENIKDRP